MKKKPVIGLVMKSLKAEFFQTMRKGALKFAAEQNNFQLITTGTNSQTEIELQIELIESLIQQKVDGLVVIPIDSKALVPVVAKAVLAGVKVVNIDIRLDEDLLQQYGIELTYVGPDNVTAAKLVGDVLAEKIGEGAKVILIEGLPVAENAQQRKQGFLKSVTEHQLDLIASEPADWETKKAEEVFSNLIYQHPDVKGVMCSNDAMALGVIKVLERKGKAGSIPVVGFDNDASIQPYLISGVMVATIDIFGSQMAVQGIEYALKIIGGLDNKGSYATDFKLIESLANL
ncbi:sugar ABC transporter substrate-binding protein [Microbacter margulisiae]|uniref:Ribose transport system substrate-binding protein n=1 Tax=Microbacter margulisiae TaxID=1350067 RepID=A0A7W5H3W5_9PORP|nr:sugar ABC transporter substrate-binding protein [Microbacter margulisiae]MBB3188762.1 ribose transport system substrate-binding protein [Microbacter margulisiae]